MTFTVQLKDRPRLDRKTQLWLRQAIANIDKETKRVRGTKP